MSAPDRSYGWYKAHCFNDYMERVIGTFLITTFLLLFIIIIILLIIIIIIITITVIIIIIIITICKLLNAYLKPHLCLSADFQSQD